MFNACAVLFLLLPAVGDSAVANRPEETPLTSQRRTTQLPSTTPASDLGTRQGAQIPANTDAARGFGASMRPAGPSGDPLAGDWQLRWDDAVDGELTGDAKTCQLRLRVVDGVVSGDFVGPVAGRQRTAVITGQAHDGPAGRLLVFQQFEQGYVCTYQLFQGHGTGVWTDTEGRRGDVELLKYQ